MDATSLTDTVLCDRVERINEAVRKQVKFHREP